MGRVFPTFFFFENRALGAQKLGRVLIETVLKNTHTLGGVLRSYLTGDQTIAAQTLGQQLPGYLPYLTHPFATHVSWYEPSLHFYIYRG